MAPASGDEGGGAKGEGEGWRLEHIYEYVQHLQVFLQALPLQPNIYSINSRNGFLHLSAVCGLGFIH